MTRAAALPQAPAQGGPTSGRVCTDFLDGLLGYNARRTSLQLVACFVRDLTDLQLKPVGFSVLCLVGHNPGITSRQLCQTLDIQAPNLVGLVSALTERGCLERLPHPTDGRAWGLHLTPAGESLLAQAETRILASEQQACAGLSSAEQATLKQLLQKIYLS
jgi:DNA-binding MarR family transcriptional regulator